MAKRIYEQSVKKWALGAGIPTGIAGFALLFLYLSTLGLIEVKNYSDDMVCAGTINDPCLAFIEFTVNETFFLYPLGYDPYGRATPFYTDEKIESWKMYRSWGSGWREINLKQTCKGTWCGGSGNINVYSFAFREGRSYKIKIEALKKDPTQTVKWGFGPVDPFWYGVGDVDFSANVSTINMELNSPINISANISGIATVCVDIDHPSYGLEYVCGSPNAEFVFNISYFRKKELNDNSMIKNISWNGGGNRTVYINAHQYDELDNFTINVSGFVMNNTFPTSVKIYINDTLSNTLGLVFSGSTILDETNNSNTVENLTYTTSGIQMAYLKIPKNAVVSSAFMNLSSYETDYSFTSWYDEEYSWTSEGEFQSLHPASLFVDENFNTYTIIGVGDVTNPPVISNITEKTNITEVIYAHDVTDLEVFIKWEEPFPTVIEVQYKLWNVTTAGYTIVFDVLCGPQCCSETLSTAADSVLQSSSVVWGMYEAEWIAGVGTGSSSVWESKVRVNASYFINNPNLEVGSPDGTYEWEYVGEFNHTNNRTDNFSGAINTALSICVADDDGFCIIPLSFTSDSPGILQISDIAINYTSNLNLVTISTSLVSSFLGNSTNFADIPIKFESTKNGTLQINDIRFDYAGGNDTIDVLVYDGGTTGYSILNFNNSLQIENLTFLSNQNITRYLDLPKLSNVN